MKKEISYCFKCGKKNNKNMKEVALENKIRQQKSTFKNKKINH